MRYDRYWPNLDNGGRLQSTHSGRSVFYKADVNESGRPATAHVKATLRLTSNEP